MFAALLERRWQEFRRGMYGQAMLLAQTYNLHRPENAPIMSGMEFLPGFHDPDSEKLDQVRSNVMAWHSMHPDATPEQVAALRTRVVASLKQQGFEKAEEMFDSIFEH